MATTRKTESKKAVSDCSGKKSNGVNAKSSTKKSGTTRCKKSATTK